MDVLVVEKQLSTLGSRRQNRSVSKTRGLASLPHGGGRDYNNIWKSRFIPTVIALYALEMHDIWRFELETKVPVLQKIWDATYPGKTTTVLQETQDAVFYQVFPPSFTLKMF